MKDHSVQLTVAKSALLGLKGSIPVNDTTYKCRKTKLMMYLKLCF